MDSGIDHPVGSLGVLVITIPNYWFTEAWNPGDLILIDQANHIVILSLILWQIIGAVVISMTKFFPLPWEQTAKNFTQFRHEICL